MGGTPGFSGIGISIDSSRPTIVDRAHKTRQILDDDRFSADGALSPRNMENGSTTQDSDRFSDDPVGSPSAPHVMGDLNNANITQSHNNVFSDLMNRSDDELNIANSLFSTNGNNMTSNDARSRDQDASTNGAGVSTSGSNRIRNDISSKSTHRRGNAAQTNESGDDIRSLRALQRSVLTLQKRVHESELQLFNEKKRCLMKIQDQIGNFEQKISDFGAMVTDIRRGVAEFRMHLRGADLSALPVEIPEGMDFGE